MLVVTAHEVVSRHRSVGIGHEVVSGPGVWQPVRRAARPTGSLASFRGLRRRLVSRPGSLPSSGVRRRRESDELHGAPRSQGMAPGLPGPLVCRRCLCGTQLASIGKARASEPPAVTGFSAAEGAAPKAQPGV
jgi:hypothetical protein